MLFCKWMVSRERLDGGKCQKLCFGPATNLVRWVYIIEGCFSILVAVIVFFGLPNDPTQAWFLNAEEREMMRCRNGQRQKYLGKPLPLALESILTRYPGSEKFSWEEIRIELRDPKLYLSGLIQFMQDILLYGFSTFLPSILKAMNYDTLQSNYLTIPVYLWGAIIFLCLAWVSDRYEIRGPVSANGSFPNALTYESHRS